MMGSMTWPTALEVRTGVPRALVEELTGQLASPRYGVADESSGAKDFATSVAPYRDRWWGSS